MWFKLQNRTSNLKYLRLLKFDKKCPVCGDQVFFKDGTYRCRHCPMIFDYSKYPPDELTRIETFAGRYIGKKKSDGTVAKYLMNLGAFFSAVGYKPVTEVSVEDVIHYQAIIAKLPGRGSGEASSSTIAAKLSALTCYLTFVRRTYRDLILNISRDDVERPKVNQIIPEPFDAADIVKLVSLCMTTEEDIIIRLLYSTGLRAFELLGLKISELTSTFERDGDFIVVKGKGNKERSVPISEDLEEDLKAFVSQAMKRKSKRQRFMGDDRLFPFSYGTLRRRVIRIAERAPETDGEFKKRVRPHVFRHTFCTDLLSNGVDSRVIQAMSGHRSPAALMRYTHVKSKTAKTAIEKLPALPEQRKDLKPLY